jgi:hypothetical protein
MSTNGACKMHNAGVQHPQWQQADNDGKSQRMSGLTSSREGGQKLVTFSRLDALE